MYNEVSFSLNSKSFAGKLMKLEIIQMNEPDSDKFHILSHMQTLYIYKSTYTEYRRGGLSGMRKHGNGRRLEPGSIMRK